MTFVELETLTWQEAERIGAEGAVGLVALAALEQHGPHLPLATDTLVADALAVRLAARVDGAVALPALPLGISPEHMAFPGTLAVTPATLAALLADVLRSLRAHGVARAFVFSAHGGNVAALRDALPVLQAATPELRVDAMTDLDGLTGQLHAEATRFGVAPESAGHHAGELETSIMLHLRPELVVTDAMAKGYVTPTHDAQALFYPDVRRNAPDGVVGDPRGATALRGARYLDVWVDALEKALRR